MAGVPYELLLALEGLLHGLDHPPDQQPRGEGQKRAGQRRHQRRGAQHAAGGQVLQAGVQHRQPPDAVLRPQPVVLGAHAAGLPAAGERRVGHGLHLRVGVQRFPVAGPALHAAVVVQHRGVGGGQAGEAVVQVRGLGQAAIGGRGRAPRGLALLGGVVANGLAVGVDGRGTGGGVVANGLAVGVHRRRVAVPGRLRGPLAASGQRVQGGVDPLVHGAVVAVADGEHDARGDDHQHRDHQQRQPQAQPGDHASASSEYPSPREALSFTCAPMNVSFLRRKDT